MSNIAKFSAALAATSVIALSASAAHATVNIPKPMINIPKPVISVAVPKPALHVVTPKITAPVTRFSWPVTRIPTMSKNQAMIVVKPVVIAPKPVTVPVANATPIKPGTVQFVTSINLTKPGTAAIAKPAAPAPVAIAKPAAAPAPVHQPVAAAKPAAVPAPAPAAKPKVTFTPVRYPAFTVQGGVVKGYYVNGKLVSGLTGPTGGNCSPVVGYQTLGGNGSVSPTPQAGMVAVTAVLCYVKS